MIFIQDVLVAVIFASSLPHSEGKAQAGFLRHQPGEIQHMSVNMEAMEQSIQAALDGVLSGHGGAARERVANIEAITWRSFQAMPKNSFGRLDPRGVRHVVHSYFAKQHGWIINGLEPHGMKTNLTEVHHVSILQDKVPALVETLLESRESGRGLTLGDVVAMIAALEQLIFDDSVKLLEAAYHVNGFAQEDHLDMPSLFEVMQSYVLIFRQDDRVQASDPVHHKQMFGGLWWPELEDYLHDIIQNAEYAQRNQANPFRPRMYSFADAADVMTEIAHGFGKFQHDECIAMKNHLMDAHPDGSGRVPLSTFHSQPPGRSVNKNMIVYQFAESADYLRQIGALDDTESGNPRVLIPNYITGPTNCLTGSTYFSVCCLNECELLLNEIEGSVLAPTAYPEHLLGLVSRLSSPSVDAPRQLSRSLEDKIHKIADLHGGMVPLQGRLFSQWLHYAFPNECPYPSIIKDVASLSRAQWPDNSAAASAEERNASVAKLQSAAAIAPSDPGLAQWSDDEVLPLFEQAEPSSSMLLARSFFRFSAISGALFVVGQAILAAWKTTKTAYFTHGITDEKYGLSRNALFV